MNEKTIGFAMTGSFCTFRRVIDEIGNLCQTGATVIPIMSQNAYTTDTRFGSAADFIAEIESITGQKIIHTIAQAEPIGPKNYLDTPVTMAAKATLRNQKPVVIAVSTNDGLGGSGKNIGLLLNQQNLYFVPYGEDDPEHKPKSLVADMTKITKTVELALSGKQIQPVLF